MLSIFLVVIYHLSVFFGEPCSNLVLVFLFLSLMGSLYVLDTCLLSGDLQIFSPNLWLVILFTSVFHRAECLALMKSNLASFSFIDYAFTVVCKNHLSNLRSQRCSISL